MKLINISFIITLLMSMVGISSTLIFTSCSGDDAIDHGNSIDNNSRRIFISSLLPQKINDYNVVTNTDGLVTKFAGKNMLINIEYNLDKHDTNMPDIVMTRLLYSNEDNKETINLTIGDNGFVSHAERIRNDNSRAHTWDFTYDSEGHLICVEVIQGSYVRYDLTWEDEDIVTVINNYGENFTVDINYINDEVMTPIYNKGNIMLLEPVFRIDMDNIGWMQYAGLFGKATRHLPVGRQLTNSYVTKQKYTYEIQLNKEGLPISYNCANDHDLYNFIW